MNNQFDNRPFPDAEKTENLNPNEFRQFHSEDKCPPPPCGNEFRAVHCPPRPEGQPSFYKDEQYPPYNGNEYRPYPPYPPRKPNMPGKGFGIASMVLGIISLVTKFFSIGSLFVINRIAYMFSYQIMINVELFDIAVSGVTIMLLSLIFGCVSRSQGYKGGSAVVGLCCSIISLLVSVMVCVSAFFII